MIDVLNAIKKYILDNKDLYLVSPVHLNQNVRKVV